MRTAACRGADRRCGRAGGPTSEAVPKKHRTTDPGQARASAADEVQAPELAAEARHQGELLGEPIAEARRHREDLAAAIPGIEAPGAPFERRLEGGLAPQREARGQAAGEDVLAVVAGGSFRESRLPVVIPHIGADGPAESREGVPRLGDEAVPRGVVGGGADAGAGIDVVAEGAPGEPQPEPRLPDAAVGADPEATLEPGLVVDVAQVPGVRLVLGVPAEA